MRLIGRNDLVLLIGLTVALFVVFSRPIAQILNSVHEIEQSSGLQLTAGLLILGGVFGFHQLRKGLEMRAQAIAAGAEARQAQTRAREMEHLVAFGQSLARSLNADSIRTSITEHLPLLVPGRSVWTMLRLSGEWQPLAQVGDVPELAIRERVADRAIGREAPGSPLVDQECFPMTVGGEPIGVLAVAANTQISSDERRTLEAAVALLAVSIKNAELFREIHENSVKDALTGCFNRRHTLEVLDGELRRARRSRLPLSVIMFDMDHFKAVNDQHGHLCGDAVLTAVGQRMRAVLRGSDVKCRYGGEEFLVLLPDTPLVGAERVADTLRRDLESQPLPWNGTAVSLSASFGVTAIAVGEISSDAIIGRADAALYRAKQDGRNCIRIVQASGPSLPLAETGA